MWVEVSPSAPFDPGYYHPVLAGLNDKQQKQFIAMPIENYWYSRDKIIVISEGDTVLTYRDFDGEEMHTDSFRILVMRFEEESYPTARIKEARKYAEHQGPIYWTEEEPIWRSNVGAGLGLSPVYAFTQ